MKIGILTIIDSNNYGNRLQNYAVQEILKNYSDDVVTLKNQPFTNSKKFYLLRRLKSLRFEGLYSDNINRKKCFCDFNSNIKFSKYYVNPFFCCSNYDYVVVGSDQVWNPYIKRLRDGDLLSFVKGNKRIAFSASFSIKDIPNNLENKVRKELSKFKAISVREAQGINIINNLLDRKDIELLIDPTMVLTSQEWDKVSKKPIGLKNKKYILCYFLGKLSEERKKEINRIAEKNNCEIIDILDKNSKYYETGPSEFLYLEKNAFLICTDSFHSCVFAILYNKPFIIFDREDNIEKMNSRIDTLLSKFKLKDRKFEGKITDKNLQHDYTEAYKILEEERKKSKNFLERVCEIKK